MNNINEKINSTVVKANTIDELLQNCPDNEVIKESLIKAWVVINNDKYDKRLVCAISGGSDSDVMLDIVWRCDKDNKVDYVWFDTGLEYQATKDHLKYLEDRYNITIIKKKPELPIPTSCKNYGEPFMSKITSEFLQRLQRHNFQWEDEDFDTLYKKYPKCQSALQWWCNTNLTDNFNIRRNKYLKEFIIQNNPTFKISNKCCKYAKKDLIHNLLKEEDYDLNIFGVRKAEGGARVRYGNCFDENDKYDNYRPLFWYKDLDKEDYEKAYGIVHSKCYTEYGLKRTGCCGCPYGRDFEDELNVIEKHEPKLYKAVTNIFKDSYEYTRKYKEFRKMMENK